MLCKTLDGLLIEAFEKNKAVMCFLKKFNQLLLITKKSLLWFNKDESNKVSKASDEVCERASSFPLWERLQFIPCSSFPAGGVAEASSPCSTSSGLSFSYLTNLLCERHIKASPDFAERILGDHQHSLHDELSNARSNTSTRSRFKLLPSKTVEYWNSILPALSRLLVDRNAKLNHYLQNLPWTYMY